MRLIGVYHDPGALAAERAISENRAFWPAVSSCASIEAGFFLTCIMK